MDRTKLACNCKKISYGQIMDAVEGGARNFNEVQEITKCSTGCGKCREFIEVFVRNLILFPEDYK